MHRVAIRSLPVLVLLVAACAAPDTGPGSDGDRGPLGKADNFGTCVIDDGDACGGKSSGSCWCDDECESYGDCCEDKGAVCDGDVAPPEPVERSVEVIFTAPFCDVCSSSDKAVLLAKSPIIAKVVELLDGAAGTVDIAQYTFSRRGIEAAIVRAVERGVAVRVAMDKAQDRRGSLARRLVDAGVTVRFIDGKGNGSYAGIQHAKFMIVDGATLLTGSNNWSSTGTSINSENTIVVTATADEPQIAGFQCHFEAIWEDDESAVPACSTDDIAFSPSSAARTMIRDAIRDADTSVDVLMHHLTFDALVKELAKAQERGVQVRVVTNAADRADYAGGSWPRLFAAGGQLRFKQNNESAYQLSHEKLAIIDGKVVINGSGNWSGSAFFNNYENYVRYSETAVVDAFNVEFARLWSWSLTGDSIDGGVSAAQQDSDSTTVFFGNLHAHFAASNGVHLLDDGKGMIKDEDGNPVTVVSGSTVTESARLAFEYARDMAGLDFMALTPHCSDDRASDSATMPNMSADGFQEMRGAAGQVNAASGGAFLAIAGMEWSTNSLGNHINIFGTTEISKVERGEFAELYDGFLPERAAAGDKPFVMFNHARTMRMHEDSLNGSWDQIFGVNLTDIPKKGERKRKFNDYGLDDYAPMKDVLADWIAGSAMPDPAVVDATLTNIDAASSPYLRLMEVTLNRGTEFASETAINPSMSTTLDGTIERRIKAHTDWDYYLLHGFRMAPVASHDNHWSNWGTGHTSRTAIIASELTSGALLDAIDRRQVFASEDENLELRLYAGGRVPMGAQITTTGSSVGAELKLADPDYSGAYEVRLYVGRVGADAVELRTTYQRGSDGWLSFTVPAALGTSFFYVEVLELDTDRMAWSAPIWIERL